MAARDEAGQPMTNEELRDELITMLFAGHETTATALTWALYWIHKLPAVREKLLQELDSLGENPDSNVIFKLPYLNAVYSETLRIYPVGMLNFPRVVRTPLSLCGHQLEPGTVILGSIYLTHQREIYIRNRSSLSQSAFWKDNFRLMNFCLLGEVLGAVLGWRLLNGNEGSTGEDSF
jgi:cytochrome P450